MPVSYRFDPEAGLCIWTMSGQVTAAQIMDSVRQARADDAWSNDYDFLSIFTDADISAISDAEVAELVAALSALDTPSQDGHRKRGAIVCSDALAEAIMTVYEVRSKPRRRSVERHFTTEAEARDWLSSPVETAQVLQLPTGNSR